LAVTFIEHNYLLVFTDDGRKRWAVIGMGEVAGLIWKHPCSTGRAPLRTVQSQVLSGVGQHSFRSLDIPFCTGTPPLPEFNGAGIRAEPAILANRLL
jgi:hypothetical protein